MNKKMTSFVACCLIGFGVQVAGYIYLDQVLFAPLSAEDYDLSDIKSKNNEALDKAGRSHFCLLYTSDAADE